MQGACWLPSGGCRRYGGRFGEAGEGQGLAQWVQNNRASPVDRWSVRRWVGPHAGREGVFGALTDKHWNEKLMALASVSQRSCQRTSSTSWTNGKPRNGQLCLVITHSFTLSTNIYSPPTNSTKTDRSMRKIDPKSLPQN